MPLAAALSLCVDRPSFRKKPFTDIRRGQLASCASPETQPWACFGLVGPLTSALALEPAASACPIRFLILDSSIRVLVLTFDGSYSMPSLLPVSVASPSFFLVTIPMPRARGWSCGTAKPVPYRPAGEIWSSPCMLVGWHRACTAPHRGLLRRHASTVFRTSRRCRQPGRWYYGGLRFVLRSGSGLADLRAPVPLLRSLATGHQYWNDHHHLPDVSLIERQQNKDSLATQLKLSEIVAAVKGASNRMITIEDLSEAELTRLHERYRELTESVAGHQDTNACCSVDDQQPANTLAPST